EPQSGTTPDRHRHWLDCPRGHDAPQRDRMAQAPLAQALTAYRNGDFDRAAERCRAGLRASSADTGLLTLLAMAEHAAGRHAQAAEAFEALTRAYPRIPEYWANLGYMLRLAGRYAEAEAAF